MESEMNHIKLTEDEKKKIESYEKNGTTIVCSEIHGGCYSNNYEITDTENGLVICTDCGRIYQRFYINTLNDAFKECLGK